MTVHTASVPAPAAAPVRAARVASNETSGRALARAVAVETRKLVNTRIGPVLIAAAALLSGAFAGGRALFPTTGTDFGKLASMAVVPASMISMVLAVLLVAGEFSARTASVTLTLDPRRGRLVLAKSLTVLGLWVVATTLAVVAEGPVMGVGEAGTRGGLGGPCGGGAPPEGDGASRATSERPVKGTQSGTAGLRRLQFFVGRSGSRCSSSS